MALQTVLNRDADVVVPSTNDNRFGVSTPASSVPTMQMYATKVAKRIWIGSSIAVTASCMSRALLSSVTLAQSR